MAMVVLSLLPQGAGAGQVTAGMSVGLTIAPSAVGEKAGARQLVVPAFVTRIAPANSYTWNAAAISVKSAGFSLPRRVRRSPDLYWFSAKQGSESFRIAVSILSGRVMKVIRA